MKIRERNNFKKCIVKVIVEGCYVFNEYIYKEYYLK